MMINVDLIAKLLYFGILRNRKEGQYIMTPQVKKLWVFLLVAIYSIISNITLKE